MVDNFSLAKHFESAAADIKTYGKSMSSDDMGKCYGLFKQSNLGDLKDNNVTEPSFYQLTEKGKYNAWKSQEGKSKDEAKHLYVELCLKYFPDDVKSKYN